MEGDRGISLGIPLGYPGIFWDIQGYPRVSKDLLCPLGALSPSWCLRRPHGQECCATICDHSNATLLQVLDAKKSGLQPPLPKKDRWSQAAAPTLGICRCRYLIGKLSSIPSQDLKTSIFFTFCACFACSICLIQGFRSKSCWR